jgi:predicted nucleic acid-binding protein
MGLIYLDACLLIYLAERHPRWGEPVATALAQNVQMHFGISPLVKCECLVAPMRRGDWVLRDAYLDLFTRFVALDMPETVYLKAAELRARFGLKTLDALHLACAQHHRCNALWTNDDRLSQPSFGLTHRIPPA